MLERPARGGRAVDGGEDVEEHGRSTVKEVITIAAMAAAAVETHNLEKTYGTGVQALADLDLRVDQGEVFGYLGPNGAGKSTTIRLLLDLIRPTSGRAFVLGLDPTRDGVEARRRTGYLPGDLRLADRLTTREQLDSLARLRGGVDVELRNQLCERFGVVLDRSIRHLSKGNRQKVGLVQAFMHRPDLVVLDEPSSGLDPLLQAELRSLLRETAADGRTVFLSSHSLDEVQHVADRVGIIRNGRLADVDAVERLRERALRHVTIVFAEPVDGARFAVLDGVRVENADGKVLRLSAPEPAMDAVVKEAAAHPVVDLVSQPADLEEIFLELYEGPGDGG
jgi:ABC-2 type transport system ATP-binding protein